MGYGESVTIDSITIKTKEPIGHSLLLTNNDSVKHEGFIRREYVESVTVVINGFTCHMDADMFFKTIDEAFKW